MKIELNGWMGIGAVGVSIAGMSQVCHKAIEIIRQAPMQADSYTCRMFQAHLLIGSALACLALAQCGLTLLEDQYRGIGRCGCKFKAEKV